jgi:hypothetical protein
MATVPAPRGPEPGRDPRPRDPTSAVQPRVPGAPDAPPPAAPRELDADPDLMHAFEVAGEVWIAKLAGKGAGGTGAYGLGMLDAVHFCREPSPDVPVAEALVARGRFAHLFDDELRELFARARAITQPTPEQPSRNGPQPHPRRLDDDADQSSGGPTRI